MSRITEIKMNGIHFFLKGTNMIFLTPLINIVNLFNGCFPNLFDWK